MRTEADIRTDWLALFRMLETRQEDRIVVTRGGEPYVEIRLAEHQDAPEADTDAPTPPRIGIADGLYKIPEEFDEWDKEIEGLFDAMAEEDWHT